MENPLPNPPKATIEQVGKLPVSYILMAAIGLLCFGGGVAALATDQNNANCQAEKRELRKELDEAYAQLKQEREAKEAFYQAMLIKSGVINTIEKKFTQSIDTAIAKKTVREAPKK